MSASVNLSRPSRRAMKPFRSPAMRGKRRKFVPTKTIIKIVERQGERKFFDNSFSTASAVTWAVFSSNIVNVGEGVTNQLRIGSKIMLQSIHLRMVSTISNVESQANPINDVLTRIILGVSKNGGTVAVADILDLGSTTDLLSWRTIDTATEFTVLADFFVEVQPTQLNEGAVNLFATGEVNSPVQKFSKVFNKPLKMSFTTATTTATQNGIFLMVISTSIGATIKIETRARFTDT